MSTEKNRLQKIISKNSDIERHIRILNEEKKQKLREIKASQNVLQKMNIQYKEIVRLTSFPRKLKVMEGNLLSCESPELIPKLAQPEFIKRKASLINQGNRHSAFEDIKGSDIVFEYSAINDNDKLEVFNSKSNENEIEDENVYLKQFLKRKEIDSKGKTEISKKEDDEKKHLNKIYIGEKPISFVSAIKEKVEFKMQKKSK